MPHMMDDFPLLLSTLYDRAVRLFPNQEIVSVESDRSVIRNSYAETDERVRRLATALDRKLGVGPGQAVGTFAWNNQRHHELYWATANTGRICHTLNIRLFADQLEYVINHGEDQVVFVDPDLAGLFAPIVPRLKTVKAYVVMGGDASDSGLPNAISYEDLIGDAEPHGAWPELSERSPMMFCYTSGTTGRSCHLSWEAPTTAASATCGWAINRFSRSTEEIHSPPDLIKSFARSVMRTYPSGVILHTSPVRSHPSWNDWGDLWSL